MCEMQWWHAVTKMNIRYIGTLSPDLLFRCIIFSCPTNVFDLGGWVAGRRMMLVLSWVTVFILS